MNSKPGKTLRIIAIVFMGLTAAMNLLGGTGTVCAAFLTREYPPLWDLWDYRWLYQIVMILTILTGIAGGWVTVTLIRRSNKAYRNALIILIIGTILGAIQFIASLLLRGKAIPANMKFYANLVTLILFLIFKLPGIRERVNFTGLYDPAEGMAAGGLSAIVAGIALLSTIIWAGPSHAYEGTNWINVLMPHLTIGGAALLFCGIGLIAWSLVRRAQDRAEAAEPWAVTRH